MPKPLDIDDSPPPVQRPHRPSRKPHAGDVWGVIKLSAIGLAMIFFVIAGAINTIHHAVVLGSFSFFLLGLARLAQAEQHRYPL